MRIQQFDYNVNVLQAILWQQDQATNLVQLATQKNAWYQTYQTQFWTDWYNNVFNLITANTFGLSVWSYILNVPLYIDFNPEPDNAPIFGFNFFNPSYPDLGNSYFNFGNGNFSTKNAVLTLTEEEQRFLLRLTYYKYCSRADVTDVNAFLNYLVTTSDIGYSGTIYMLDGLDMSITYVFSSPGFPPNLLQAIKDLDTFPRAAGVGIKYVINTGTGWGFGPKNQNFGNGNFLMTVS